jgi:hypothetical protein
MFWKKPAPMGNNKNKIIYDSNISRFEQKEMERIFARLFATEDGIKVLSWLQMVTFHRASGAATPNDQLKYMEGQRSLVATILRMIDRGRKG